MEIYMGLKCKNDKFIEVLKRLIFRIFVDKQDIYVLNSPIDILVRLNAVSNVEEFIAQWFNPIKNLFIGDDLVTKIQSFIVTSSNSVPPESPSAFVFVNAQTDRSENVLTSLFKIPEVLSADSVLGCYNIIGSFKTKNRPDCKKIFSKIKQISGIMDSSMSLVDTINIFSDW